MDLSGSSTSLTAPLTQHICSPECADCFRRRVCRDGHDYTDAMPPTLTLPPIGLAYEHPPLTLFCRRCGNIP